MPQSEFLSSKIGPAGIWWAIPAGWAIGLSLSFLYYKTRRWKKKSVVKFDENL